MERNLLGAFRTIPLSPGDFHQKFIRILAAPPNWKEFAYSYTGIAYAWLLFKSK